MDTITAKQHAGMVWAQAKQAFTRGPVFFFVILLPALVATWLILTQLSGIYQSVMALLSSVLPVQNGVRLLVCTVTPIILGLELAGFFVHRLRVGHYRWLTGFSGIIWAAAVFIIWNVAVPTWSFKLFGTLSGADMAAITYGAIFGLANWGKMDFRKVGFPTCKGGRL